MISESETLIIIDWFIKNLNITDLNKQRWQIMWAIKSKYSDEIDMAIVNKLIMAKL